MTTTRPRDSPAPVSVCLGVPRLFFGSAAARHPPFSSSPPSEISPCSLLQFDDFSRDLCVQSLLEIMDMFCDRLRYSTALP